MGRKQPLFANDCGAVIQVLPDADHAQAALVEMASSEICTAICPHCGDLNVFPGFSVIDAFVCQSCEQGVVIERPVQ
jgi:hypothetical protein